MDFQAIHFNGKTTIPQVVFCSLFPKENRLELQRRQEPLRIIDTSSAKCQFVGPSLNFYFSEVPEEHLLINDPEIIHYFFERDKALGKIDWHDRWMKSQWKPLIRWASLIAILLLAWSIMKLPKF